MAGTVTCTETKSKPIKRVVFAWTCTSGGAADKITPSSFYGELVEVVTVPDGTDIPTDGYDITLVDALGNDVLQGDGANLSATVLERLAPPKTSMVFGQLTLNVANAGNAKKGTVTLYIR